MSDGGTGPGELAQALWLKDEQAQSAVAALESGGGEARFVGGCVRNALMRRPVADVDIATTLPPEVALELLQKAGFKVVPTGLAHGTVTAVGAKGTAYEVTTLRRDVETDGRHAQVAFTTDWAADAARRDFTMNALYADAAGHIHDPLGGRGDLDAGLVRFIGDPVERIREDYLRILRFFRFYAGYGRGEPDTAALQACGAEAEGLKRISGERIRVELLKTLAADNGPKSFRLMAASGVLPIVLPEAARLDRLERVVEIEADQLFACDPILRLAAALELESVDLEVLSQRLHLSNKDRDRLTALSADRTKIVSYLSMREVRQALYRLGTRLFKDRATLAWADDPKASNAVQWRALLAIADTWERPQLPLTGEMVKSAGVPEGPEIGRVMREVEDWWVEADFIEDEFSIIERLKAVVQATVY